METANKGIVREETRLIYPVLRLEKYQANIRICFYQYCTMLPEYCALAVVVLSASKTLENFIVLICGEM